jgi:tRNA G37 N-methylase TrmD
MGGVDVDRYVCVGRYVMEGGIWLRFVLLAGVMDALDGLF